MLLIMMFLESCLIYRGTLGYQISLLDRIYQVFQCYNNNNNNNNFIWVLNFPVSSMDFTNKLIYIYDTQNGI